MCYELYIKPILTEHINWLGTTLCNMYIYISIFFVKLDLIAWDFLYAVELDNPKDQ